MVEASARTSPRRVTVIDAGVGNLGNLARALRHLDAEVEVTTEAERLRAGRCLVLPGVGAFRPPRERLRGALEGALAEVLDDGGWLLGICVGFQLLYASSDEFGDTDGLSLLPGNIRRLPTGVPIPHIGWNRLRPPRGDSWEHPLLAGIEPGSHVYFVHSYAALDPVPATAPSGSALAVSRHGAEFTAVAGRSRVLGTQFHPEKSGRIGLRLLENYLALAHGESPEGRRATGSEDLSKNGDEP